MMTPKEKFDQALKTSLRNPYDDLLSFSIDPNGNTLLNLHADLLKDETMFENLVEVLRTDLPTNSLHVSLQPSSEYDVQDRFSTLQESLQDEIQVTRAAYQEESNPWKSYLITGGIIATGVVAGPLLVVGGLGALGFGAGGVAAGSVAASIMSMSGGTVAAGGACAVAQSIGAAGLGAAGTVVASSVGGAIAGLGVKLFSGSGNSDGETTQNNYESNNENAEEEEISKDL